MHAVIRSYEGLTKDAAEDVAQRTNSGFRRRLREQPGFVAYELVIGEDGTMTSLTVFDNWVVAEESNLMARTWIREQLADVPLPTPTVIVGEVFQQPEAPAPFTPAAKPRLRLGFDNPGDAQYG